MISAHGKQLLTAEYPEIAEEYRETLCKFVGSHLYVLAALVFSFICTTFIDGDAGAQKWLGNRQLQRLLRR